MDKNLLTKAIFTLFCFGLWPALARKSGVPAAWITLFLGCAILIAAVYSFLTMPKQSLPTASDGTLFLPAVLILMLGVALNASGSVSFSGILSSPDPNAFAYVALVTAGVPAIIKLGGLFFDPNEQLTWKNAIGLVGVVVSIFFIMDKGKS